MKIKTQLREIASFAKGSQINGDDLIENGKYDYLNGGITPSGKWNAYNTPGGTVTISEGGNSCGYVNYMREPFWCGAHCYYLFDPIINAEYLYYMLKSQQDRLMRIRTGACMPNIKKSDLGSFELEYDTDADEQQHVVSVLKKVETVITARKQQLAALDELVKARFVEMFGDMVLNPNGWKRCSLGEVCDVRDGTHDSPQYYDEGYPLVTSKNVTAGHIDLTNCSLICEDDFKKINQRSKVDCGDILMPMIGTVGNPVIVNIEPNFAIKNVALIKFKSDSKVLNSFVKALLESEYFDNAVISNIRGGTQKFISLGDIRKLEICLPPFEVQKSFENLIMQIEKSKDVVKQSLAKTQTLFDSLMQQYFG